MVFFQRSRSDCTTPQQKDVLALLRPHEMPQLAGTGRTNSYPLAKEATMRVTQSSDLAAANSLKLLLLEAHLEEAVTLELPIC